MKKFYKNQLSYQITFVICLMFCAFYPVLSDEKYNSPEQKLQECSWEDSVNIYIELGQHFVETDPIKSIDFGKKALTISERHNDNKLKADSYSSIGKGFEYTDQYDLAIAYYRDALKLYMSEKDPGSIAKSHNNIGVVYYKTRDYDSALVYYKKALEIRKRLGNYEDIAKTLNNTGGLYIVIGKYDEALKYTNELLEINQILSNKKDIANTHDYLGFINLKLGKFDAALDNYLKELKLREELNDKDEMDRFFTNIGKIYFKMKNYPKAVEYYTKALKINQINKNKIEIAKSLSNLGNVYYESKEYKKALDFYHRSLDLTDGNSHDGNIPESRKMSFKHGKAVLLNNIGLVYKNLGNYKKALNYCKRSIEIKEKIGDLNNLFYPLTSIAEIYLKLGNFDESLNYLIRCLDIANEKNNLTLLKEAHYLIYEVYASAGNYKNALENHKIYTAMKDTLLEIRNNKLLSEMQTKFETAKKEQENKALKEANTLQRDYFIVISALILFILGVTYSRYHSKRKANKLLSEKNQQINHQHKELEYMFSQLQSKEENLREVNATKDKFFSIIAHDLKNPLHAITLSSDLLINKYNSMDSEQLIALTKNINTAGNHLSSLLENLLQWAGTQNGKINFQPQSVDLKQIIQENIELTEANAKKKNISINSNVIENSYAYADTNMLKAIFRNLLSNAIKFTNMNGEVTIEINELDYHFFEVSVVDNGIGISHEDINKLFRIDIHHTTIGTSKEKGTGLGLILCKEFIEINGGKIEVESEIGKGSKFIFTIPKISQNMNEKNKKDIRVLSLN
ncbi:tetratricopeptide repeat protein [Bacteroidota bacterium]